MTGFFANKKRAVSAVLTVIFAISFGAVAACIIAAAPRDNNDFEPQITVFIEPDRVSAPIQGVNTSLPDSENASNELERLMSPTAVTIHTDNIKVDAPETAATEQVPVTSQIAVTESKASQKVTTEPEIEFPEFIAPEITFTETSYDIVVPTVPEGPFYVAPELKSGFLADELSVKYTVNKPKFTVTEEELYFAATIIQLEVMGSGSSLYKFDDVTEKYWEMCAVAQCIRNRVESRLFPGTVEEVIFQSHKLPSGRVIYQFSPAKTLSNFTPTEEAMVAAREVLLDGVCVLPTDYYYFCATRIEASFEKSNTYMLCKLSDGTHEKVQGHLTTFYAGRE